MEEIEKAFKWLTTEREFTNGDNVVLWILVLSTLFK